MSLAPDLIALRHALNVAFESDAKLTAENERLEREVAEQRLRAQNAEALLRRFIEREQGEAR